MTIPSKGHQGKKDNIQRDNKISKIIRIESKEITKKLESVKDNSDCVHRDTEIKDTEIKVCSMIVYPEFFTETWLENSLLDSKRISNFIRLKVGQT